jgi:hypothetical protein
MCLGRESTLTELAEFAFLLCKDSDVAAFGGNIEALQRRCLLYT